MPEPGPSRDLLTDPAATGAVALALAREAVECYLLSGALIDPPASRPRPCRKRGGAFVTLRVAAWSQPSRRHARSLWTSPAPGLAVTHDPEAVGRDAEA
jgi:hypothetical protein